MHILQTVTWPVLLYGGLGLFQISATSQRYLQDNIRTTFQCSELEGAILIMPQGAYHQDLRRHIGKIRDYADTNLASWYDYANIVHGLELHNSEIRLVIGCDKTTSWGIATYSHRQSEHVENKVTNLSFNVNSEGHSLYPKYVWDANGMAIDLKVGPEDVEILDPPEVHARMPLQNQCTFIRSLNLALGDKEWKQHQFKVANSTKAQASSAQPTHKNSFTSVSGAINSPSSYLSGDYDGQHFHGHSNLGLSVASTQVSAFAYLKFILLFIFSVKIPLVYHPATSIISMLLRKVTIAQCASQILFDETFCSVPGQGLWLSMIVTGVL